MFLRPPSNRTRPRQSPKTQRTLVMTPKKRNTSFIPGKKRPPVKILGKRPSKIRNHRVSYSGVHGDTSGNVMW